MKHLIYLTFALIGLFANDVLAQDILRPQPEISTGVEDDLSVATAERAMVVTAHPLATLAARDIIAKGGSAVDAMITAQLVLGLVEPQSSGLGGGAFALYQGAKTDKLKSYDARETAPQEITPELFLRKNGKPVGFYDGAIGGRSVGVPGTPALLKILHNRYGTLTWEELFEPAIELAENGIVVTPRLAKMSANAFKNLYAPKETLNYFKPNGVNLKAGDVLKNPSYAQTLKTLRDEGIEPFYWGSLAKDIVKTVRNARNSGYLSLSDLEDYRVIERDPVCGGYRGYRICSMGEPSSGGLTLLQILTLLERFNLSAGLTARNVHLITEASRLAFADRNYYMADPDKVKTPATKLIDTEYLQHRSRLMNSDKRMPSVERGVPEGWEDQRGEEVGVDAPGTSHIVIVDEQGNMITMTTTIETAFGSRLMTNGFLLNNELTDFSFLPVDKKGHAIANAPASGKRPRSSMSPTIVYRPDGTPYLLIGSAGGSHIIGYVAARLIGLLDWNMSLEDAMRMPNFIGKDKVIVLEPELSSLKPHLRKLGHKVDVTDLNSGLTAIEISRDKLKGVADPRREGLARGL